MKTNFTLTLVLSLALAGCSIGGDRSTSTTSTRPVQASTGTVTEDMGLIAGAHVGGALGSSLTREDQEILQRTTQKALESGRTGWATKWRNAATGTSGSITPQLGFQMNGRNCREFQQDITVNGKLSTGYGTACRGRRGIWRIAENG